MDVANLLANSLFLFLATLNKHRLFLKKKLRFYQNSTKFLRIFADSTKILFDS